MSFDRLSGCRRSAGLVRPRPTSASRKTCSAHTLAALAPAASRLPTICQAAAEMKLRSGGVIQRACCEHGDENAKPAIRHTAERARVTVPPCPQRIVVGSRGRRVVLDADARPVIQRLAQPRVYTRSACGRKGAFAAALGHGRRAGVGAERVIIAGGHRASRLSEHRGGHHSSDPWQGPEDFDVTMLARLTLARLGRGQFLEQPIDLPLSLRALLVHQDQLGDQRGDARGHSVRHTGRDGQPGLSQHLDDVVHGAGAESDACATPARSDAGGSCAQRVGIGRPLQDRPEPRLIGRRTQRQPRSVDAIELLAQPIREAAFVDLQIVHQATQFPQVNDLWVVRTDPPKGAGIRAEPIGDRLGIAAIIFRARSGKPIAEAIELFGIDRKNGKALLNRRVDQHSPRRLDPDGDRLRASPLCAPVPTAAPRGPLRPCAHNRACHRPDRAHPPGKTDAPLSPNRFPQTTRNSPTLDLLFCPAVP